MPFRTDEVDTAVADVEKDEKVSLSNELAYSFVSKVEDKKSGMPFGEALRFSLNELHIWDKDKRKLYCKVAGKIFGSHGNKVAAKKRQLGLPPKATPERKWPETTVGKNGQYAFRI